MLARYDGKVAERADGVVDVEASGNNKPLAHTNDVLVLFVLRFSAEWGVINDKRVILPVIHF